MGPWGAESIEWDDGNESELAAHGITPSEVEDVFEEGPRWAPNRRGRSGDWMMVGYTAGGRALTIIIVWHEERLLLRPITGWDCATRERTRYLS